jgi:hypothetical protein
VNDKHKNYILLGMAAIWMLAAGCDEPKERIPVKSKAELSNQYSLTLMGTFNAGYDNALREVFILKDNQTGVEYLGVTDCAVIRLVNEKRAEAIKQIAESIADELGDE